MRRHPILTLLLGLCFVWMSTLAPAETRKELSERLDGIKTEYERLDAHVQELKTELNGIITGENMYSRNFRIDQLEDMVGKLMYAENRRLELDGLLRDLLARWEQMPESEQSILPIYVYNFGHQRISTAERYEKIYAKIIVPDLPADARIGEVNWTINTPDGLERTPSRARSGADGLRWSMKSSEYSALGQYEIEASFMAGEVAYRAEGSFYLEEKNDDEDDSDVKDVQIEGMPRGKLYTGKPTRVKLSNIPFEIEDISLLQFAGTEDFAAADFWPVNLSARQVNFRPKKHGRQTPTFLVTYDERKVPGAFSCDVELTELESTVYVKRTDMRKLTIPIEIEVPDYFETPYQTRFNLPRAVNVSAPTSSGKTRLLKGEILAQQVTPVDDIEMQFLDRTDAEAFAKLNYHVQGFRIEVGEPESGSSAKKSPGIPLEIDHWDRVTRTIEPFDEKHIYTSPNIIFTKTGGHYQFWLLDDKQHPVNDGDALEIIVIGQRGIAKGNGLVEDPTDECCDVPSNVMSALRRISNQKQLMAEAMAIAQSKDEARAEAWGRRNVNDMKLIFDWWGSLDKCRHISPEARRYCQTFSKLLDLYGVEDVNEDYALGLVRQLQKGMGNEPFKRGFMCDKFENELNHLQQQMMQGQ